MGFTFTLSVQTSTHTYQIEYIPARKFWWHAGTCTAVKILVFVCLFCNIPSLRRYIGVEPGGLQKNFPAYFYAICCEFMLFENNFHYCKKTLYQNFCEELEGVHQGRK